MKLRWMAWLLAALLLVPGAAVAQKKKKGKDSKDKAEEGRVLAGAPLPAEQLIEAQLSEMLGAWQVGDLEALRKHYADDVTVVSGAYGPPLVGWASFAQAYLRQHARSQGVVQLNRRNTVIRSNGSTAWAAYQWEFLGVVDGAALRLQGHTSLVMEKRGERWLIVHNHTSLALPDSTATAEAARPAP